MRTFHYAIVPGKHQTAEAAACGYSWVPDPPGVLLLVAVLASDDNRLGFRISRLSRPLVIRPTGGFRPQNSGSPELFTYMGPYRTNFHGLW